MSPLPALLPLLIFLLASSPAKAQTAAAGKRTEIEFELDPYYTSVGWYRTLTSEPIPNVGQKNEWEIYFDLLKKIYQPRTLVLELSINPLPCLGSYIRDRATEVYDRGHVGNDFNLLESVVAGFEEPWAASVFLGNVVEFESIKKSYVGKRHGYAGLLVSGGNFHIKDSRFIADNWFETEVKLKGEQMLSDRELRWSMRAGLKHHANPYIADAYYIGLRRSRTDFRENGNFFRNNSGIEYILDVSQDGLEPLRHYFMLDKKIPLKDKRFAFSLGVGMMWTSGKKYSGPLSQTGVTGSNIQLLIRPNLEF